MKPGGKVIITTQEEHESRVALYYDEMDPFSRIDIPLNSADDHKRLQLMLESTGMDDSSLGIDAIKSANHIPLDSLVSSMSPPYYKTEADDLVRKGKRAGLQLEALSSYSPKKGEPEWGHYPRAVIVLSKPEP